MLYDCIRTHLNARKPPVRKDLEGGAIRLFYKDGGEQGKRNDLFPNGKNKVSPIGETIDTHGMLAKKAGVGKGSIGRLTEVYRNRPDLFDGSIITIN